MSYQLTYLQTEQEYRNLFQQTYCNPTNPIKTFDGIQVMFFPEHFEHAFFESSNRKKADKSKFSIVRAERILWIKDTLEDPTAELRVGWNKTLKKYDRSRRVAIIKNNYVVIVWIKNATVAKFITAYVADNSIGKILKSPVWNGI